MKEAVGLLEVYGLVAGLVAVDAACKSGNVTVESLDKNKPPNADKLKVPLLVCIKIRGKVEDVRAAIDAAEEAANHISGVVTKHVIPRPEEDTEKFLALDALKGN